MLELDTRVRLRDADGKTLAIGPKAVAEKLKAGLEVELKKDKGIVTEIKLVERNR